MFSENTATIPLFARLSDDLKWDAEMHTAEKECEQGKSILWEIDLGIDSLLLRDSAAFFSLSIALEEFTRSVYSRFKEKSSGVTLYRGDCDFKKCVPLTHWAEAFEDFVGELKGKAPQWHELHTTPPASHYHSLFGAQVLAEYLQRLISFLPDELPIFSLFDTSQEVSPSQAAQKLSRARFESLQSGGTSSRSLYDKRSWHLSSHRSLHRRAHQYCTRRAFRTAKE